MFSRALSKLAVIFWLVAAVAVFFFLPAAVQAVLSWFVMAWVLFRAWPALGRDVARLPRPRFARVGRHGGIRSYSSEGSL